MRGIIMRLLIFCTIGKNNMSPTIYIITSNVHQRKLNEKHRLIKYIIIRSPWDTHRKLCDSNFKIFLI